MRFGICILQDRRWKHSAPRWRKAEDVGFDHAWVYDHIGWRDLVDGPWFDGLLTLTAAATVTSRIALGTFVTSPNFRHPVPLAREVTALDDVSEGRLTLGIGAGGTGFDADVLGEPPLTPRARVDRFAEFVELLDRLLREDRVDWRGHHYTAVDARRDPGCVQTPRVPFVLAGNGPRTIELAARWGEGWVTTGPTTDDPERWWQGLADSSRRLTEALAGRGPRDGEFSRVLSLDSGPVYSLTTADTFARLVERAETLGFTDVVAHWPRESGAYAGSEAVLDEVVRRVIPRFRTGG